jgi:asparagine synthase (glutamine-hydrolysing)
LGTAPYMSVQFGRWSFEGQSADRGYIENVSAVLAPYGPDSNEAYSNGGVQILYRAFHTTKESYREKQPSISTSGAVITWDGRLDNRSDLISDLRDFVSVNSTDLATVTAAYDKWGVKCFAKLVGDWALSIWNPADRSLLLTKDPIGTKHLYYSMDSYQISWSTILDPLVLFAGKSFSICEEYIAGWLSYFPATHLAPHVGIHSVPPASSVLVRPGRHTVSKYWDFDPKKRICYRSDEEYEEHFRGIFAEAVRRRLRSDSPVLAELSGGMDSSSIVCMADAIAARGAAETPRLDTVSYYDDSEPTWNERPYFAKVEEKRGRTGCHIDLSKQKQADFDLHGHGLAATPSSFRDLSSESEKKYAECLLSQRNRVVLSGIGGDEVMGGVPTPTPELQDLLVEGHFKQLAHQLKIWALNKRKPWFYLLFDAAREFFPSRLVGVPKHRRPATWLNVDFVKRNRDVLYGYEARMKLFGARPTFQGNISTLAVLQRQLGCTPLPSAPTYERRYPYLDRDLLEFLYAVPREQLVRPGQRRSLMRRALVGITPDELLNRKRKAFVSRARLVAIAADWPRYAEMTQHMASSSLGIVEARKFLEVLQKARRGEVVPTVILMRTIMVEGWLRNLHRFGLANLDGRWKPESALQISAPT